MTEYLVLHKGIVVIFHVLAMAVGVGGATLTDVFFFRFLKNFRISHEEARTMKVLSGVIWLALSMAIITGLALYLTNPAGYNNTPKFLVKVVVVAVIVLNGLLLNFFISPRMTHISFVHHPIAQLDEFRHFRRMSFASGAISLTSWYTALALGVTDTVPFPFVQIIAVYIAVVVIAVIGSQIMELRYAHLARKKHSQG